MTLMGVFGFSAVHSGLVADLEIVRNKYCDSRREDSLTMCVRSASWEKKMFLLLFYIISYSSINCITFISPHEVAIKNFD